MCSENDTKNANRERLPIGKLPLKFNTLHQINYRKIRLYERENLRPQQYNLIILRSQL